MKCAVLVIFGLILPLSLFANEDKRITIADRSDVLVVKDGRFNWYPTLMKITCSAGLVEIDGAPRVVSARHCLSSNTNYIDVFAGAHLLKILDVLYPRFSFHTKLDKNELNIYADTDIFFSYPVHIPLSRVYPLSNSVLPLGSKVFIYGFPTQKLLASGSREPLKIECTYISPALSYSNNRFVIQDMAFCPHLGSAQGLSGGPVVNERGEYIGAVSAYNTRVSDKSVILFEKLRARSEIQNGVIEYPNFRASIDPERDCRARVELKNGVLDGPFMVNCKEIKKISYGNFRYGLMHGVFKTFTESGELVETIEFDENGKPRK